jgi:hypothetical protein
LFRSPLGKVEALRRLKSGMARAFANIPLLKFEDQTWSDDRMTFRARALGQVISGTVDGGDSDVRLEVELLAKVRRGRAEYSQGAYEAAARKRDPYLPGAAIT